MMDWKAANEATATRLLAWMEDNDRALGQVHVIDARDDWALRAILADYGPGWECSKGLSWQVMRIDQLVNVYIRS